MVFLPNPPKAGKSHRYAQKIILGITNICTPRAFPAGTCGYFFRMPSVFARRLRRTSDLEQKSTIYIGADMKKSKKADSVSTFLGSDGIIEGNIEFKKTIRLDGNVKGKIFSKSGTVIIGEKAVVQADINVDVVIIMGKVNGTIDARERIEVYPPGHIVGDIQAPTVLIESGVVFNGNCSMKMRKGSPAKPVEAVAAVSKPSISKQSQTK